MSYFWNTKTYVNIDQGIYWGKIAGNDKKTMYIHILWPRDMAMGFRIQKIWQVLNHFATSFHQA